MALAIPSPSPRTLRTVGGLRYLVLRADLSGPALSEGGDTPGDRRAAPLPARLRWSLAAGHMRWLLLVGHFQGADGDLGAAL
jgi:hypothetical protein